MAFLAANPAMRLFGLPTGGELGHLLMLRTFTMMAIIIALINTFTVIRHTRQNEELGRFELVGSAAVGRYAGLTAVLIVALLANVLIVGLVYAGLATGDLPASGALLMALALGAIGIVFSGIAAVCAQLTQTSRGANGLASACLAAAFLLSGIGSVLGELQPDGLMVEPAWPSWITPIGWGQLLQPFAEENWWILSLFAVFWVVSVAAAHLLSTHRDVGSGMVEARAGREFARAGLLSMTGLTWRLQKGIFISWLVGVTLLGVIYGIVAADVEDLMGQAEGIAEIFVQAAGAEEIMLAFFGAIASILGMFILAYAVQMTLRLRAEEVRALDLMLSTNVGRMRWLFVHLGGAQFR
jgi:ABC-2 type transport system permease protein